MDIDSLLTSKNPDELRSLALKLLADLERQTQRNQTQAGYIQQLEEALKNARHWRFGRKSESFQGELFDEDIEADAADIEQQLTALLPEPKVPKPQVAKRQALPPELPRQDIHLAPASDTCPDCVLSVMKSANGWNMSRRVLSCIGISARSSAVTTAIPSSAHRSRRN